MKKKINATEQLSNIRKSQNSKLDIANVNTRGFNRYALIYQ